MAKTSKPKAPKAGAKAPVSGRPTHVVLRIIQGAEGGDIYAGTPEEPVYVDACDWANASLLEQSGHLRRITPEECDAIEAARPKKEETSTEEPKIPATHEARLSRLEEMNAACEAGDAEAARIEAAIVADAQAELDPPAEPPIEPPPAPEPVQPLAAKKAKPAAKRAAKSKAAKK